MFGIVTLNEFAIKSYKGVNVPNGNIPRDAIREASILHHLNDRGVDCVPRLIAMNSTPNVEAVMEVVSGSTYLDIINGGKTVEERCKIAELHLDNIIEAIRILHDNGVIHNDMNLNNIMITDDNRVVIIDYGSSQFVNSSPLTATITCETEFVYLTKSSYQSDYWLLGDAILDACIGPTISDWSPVQPFALYRDIHINNGHARIDNDNRILGEDTLQYIVSSLADKLRPLLYWRMKINTVIPQLISRQPFKLDQSHNNYISEILVQLSTLMTRIRPTPASIIEVAIDVLRRIFPSVAYNYTTNQLVVAITSITWSRGDIANRGDIDRNLITEILDILRWRVMTLHNIRLTNQGYTQPICNKIIKDKKRYLLLSMTDEELDRYYRDI